MNIIHNKHQHTYVNNLLQYADGLYKLECDEALEEVSKVYKHIANLFTVLSNDIDKELAEVEVHVFSS